MRNGAAGRSARPYTDPYVAGALLGLVLFTAFFLTGNGLGASGGLNRITVFLEDLVAPGQVDRTAYLVGMAGGDRNPLNNWVVLMVAGTLLGGALSGWLNGRFRVETNRGPRISVRTGWALALLGGFILG